MIKMQFILSTIQSKSKYRSLLANFLEILTVLKGIKSGYIGIKQDIDLNNLNQIQDFLINSHKFVYYPNNNLIVDKKKVKNIDYNPNLLSTSMYSPDSFKLGQLLGYPCPGFNFDNKKTRVCFLIYRHLKHFVNYLIIQINIKFKLQVLDVIQN
jgi:hypothetical protein